MTGRSLGVLDTPVYAHYDRIFSVFIDKTWDEGTRRLYRLRLPIIGWGVLHLYGFPPPRFGMGWEGFLQIS